MTFEDNIFLQLCSIIMLFFSVIIFVATFIPYFGYEEDMEREGVNPIWTRLILVLIILSSIRGAF